MENGRITRRIIRVKFKANHTQVLPLDKYKFLADLVIYRYLQICQIIEQHLTTFQKQEISRSLVRFLFNIGKVTEYLTDLTAARIKRNVKLPRFRFQKEPLNFLAF